MLGCWRGRLGFCSFEGLNRLGDGLVADDIEVWGKCRGKEDFWMRMRWRRLKRLEKGGSQRGGELDLREGGAYKVMTLSISFWCELKS